MFEKPFLRKVASRLPNLILEAMEPAPQGMIVGLDENGKVIHNLQDRTGKVHDITSAIEINGSLYLGSLYMETVTKLNLQNIKNQ